ncbi:transposase [Paenibacillus sp. GCM10012307]|uniref:Transposase n=1 Tax=Paenibacillus roseus TaxID=2798579 RepID=A0A934IX63_9BACL|nr:transposase [Paenibacillus roseus]
MLDNAHIHHAKSLQSFVAEHPRLTCVFLPTYSPQLNSAEGHRSYKF